MNNTGKTEKSDKDAEGRILKVPAGANLRRRIMKALRIAVIFMTVIFVLLACARIALPGMLVSVVNSQLPKYLTSAATLKTVSLGLIDGRVAVQGLTVRQPGVFGTGLLLDLAELEVKVSVLSLVSPQFIVDEITVTDLILHLVRDRDGNMNVTCLLHPAEGDPGSAGIPKPIHIRKITVKNSSVRYTDLALGDEVLDAKLDRFNAVITDVYLNSARRHEPTLPGTAEATAQLVQPKFSDAPLGIAARFGYFYSDQPIPELNAAVRLAGLELQTLHAVVKQDKAQSIGGDIMDFNGDIAMAPELFDCTLAIVTPSGNSLRMQVGGTPQQPLVDKNSFRGIVTDRAGEAGMNVLRDIPGTGEELGRTAFSSTASAGKGAGALLTGIATTLFKAAVSISEGEMSEAGAKLMEGGSAAVPSAQAMYEKTSASLSDGAGRIGSASGGERARLWRNDVQRRWKMNWESARESVRQKPFPSPAPSASR